MLFNNNFSFEFGYTAGSVIVYNLLYNMDTFHVDASSLRTVDNADVSGVAYDMPMFGSKHVYLPATASVPYNVVNGSDYAYYDVSTKSFVKFTAGAATVTLASPTHHSNFFATNTTILAEDITYLNSNPEAIAQLHTGTLIPALSFVNTNVINWYPANEGALGGANIRNIKIAPTHFISGESSTFNTTVGSWVSYFSGTATWQTDSTIIVTNNSVAYSGAKLPISVDVNNVWYILEVEASSISGEVTFYPAVNNGDSYVSGYAPSTPQILVNGLNIIMFKPTNFSFTTTDTIVIRANGAALASVKVDNVKLYRIDAIDIVNFTADCRTNALVNNVNYGMSDFLITKNPTTGIFTGMATAGTITGENDGRFLRVPKTIPVDKTILKDVNTMSGDVSSVTITYVDLTTEVI